MWWAVNFTLQFITKSTISISISQTVRSRVIIFHLRRPMAFSSYNLCDKPALACHKNDFSFKFAFQTRIHDGTLEIVIQVFMADAASQAGDADSSRTPGLTSGLQGSVNVHRGSLLLVPQWQCISSFVFYIVVHIGSYKTISNALLANVKCHSEIRPVTATSKPIRLYTNVMTLIPNLTLTKLREVSKENLQAVWHASRER